MRELPLLAIDTLDACIASYRGAPIPAAQFIAHAELLRQALPQAAHAINLADNRYHFLLGWVAACLREQVTLLPSSQAPGVLTELQHAYPAHHVIDDAFVEGVLGQTSAAGVGTQLEHWRIPADRIVAMAFTSGSTGKPLAHPKTWGSLFRNSQLATMDVLGGSRAGIVATVPPQHMYGLEASLIGALSSGCRLYDRKPFFPADVREALAQMPAPRTLVTTPAHLKVLIDSATRLPELQRIVSATAPLGVDLAERAEATWSTEVVEIYGCTEAGVMAHRRPTRSERWHTLAGSTITSENGLAEYRAPQLDAAVPLHDVIESCSETEFFLRGRAADMIKVAGKRTSLQELTRQILSVPGIEDAVVFMPDTDARPAALVVAPNLTASGILAMVRELMEPVFVPRPLVVVERLPRNAVGKLPREALLNLLAEARA